MNHAVQVLVVELRRGDRRRAGRTLRALEALGLDAIDHSRGSASELATALQAGTSWLVRAGAWPTLVGLDITFPPASGTNRPLCAFGAICDAGMTCEPAGVRADWADVLRATGGDLGAWVAGPTALPEVASVYLEAPLARTLAEHLRSGTEFAAALAATIRTDRVRAIRYPAFDVVHDESLRVAQVVTSVQRGGAERVAIDLTEALPARGVRTLLCVMGAAPRVAYRVPATTLDLSLTGDRAERYEHLARALRRWGADLAHAHLLTAEDVARLAARGFHPLVTVHNTRAGWPAGLEASSGDGSSATAYVACSRAVEAELRASVAGVPRRTVWNGIDVTRYAPSSERAANGRAWRKRHGFSPGDLVVLAVANPRAQKRLDLLPAIIVATTRLAGTLLGPGGKVRLVLAGAASGDASQMADAVLEHAIVTSEIAGSVTRLGSVDAIEEVYAGSSVLVSCSAHEGLSLAHLEALAAGLPVIASDAGGTAEISHDALTILPLDATPHAYADAIVSALAAREVDEPFARRAGAKALARRFSREHMAANYARLYPAAVERADRLAGVRAPAAGGGILLVANNFSTGGAQSSGRRLLLGLRAAGVRVRAAVLEEQREYPTPGRRALLDAGVEVIWLPPPREAEITVAVGRLLDEIASDPPEAVVFWNAMAAHKILLADGLLDTRVFDVSPGEMFFAELERYLANPRAALPYLTERDYGARLAGVVVKYRDELARAATLGAPVQAISNGIAVASEPRSRRDAESRRLVLGTLARIHPHKYLARLIEALRIATPSLPPHVLRIAGGPDRGCEAHAAELVTLADGLAVEWVGEITEPGELLRELDALVLVAEPAGCPNASLEAMAQGLPVIATDVGAMREQIEPGVSGWLVGREDVAALGRAIVELAMDRDRAARIGEAGRQRMREHFSLDQMVASYRALCLPMPSNH